MFAGKSSRCNEESDFALDSDFFIDAWEAARTPESLIAGCLPASLFARPIIKARLLPQRWNLELSSLQRLQPSASSRKLTRL